MASNSARQGLTRTLCETIHREHQLPLAPELMAAARQAILDGLAVGVAGTAEHAVRIVAEHAQSQGAQPVATVLALGMKTSPMLAAMVNGTAIHVLDFEPMWTPPTHTTSPTLPVVLALAESQQRSGADILRAFVAGCEIQGRLRLASGQYELEAIAFHPPGVVGVLGAAVAASCMSGASVDQLRHAIGLASSRAGSLLANVGSMTKSSHCGMAASLGLDSALLVARGFQANPDVLEAPKGFIATFCEPGSFDDRALLDYGRPYRLVDPGLTLKMFPAQYATHYAITAGLQAHARIPAPEAIRSVSLTTPVMKYVDRPAPQTGLEGKFSFQYAVAAALLDGKVGIATYTDERRSRADMQALLPKVRLHQDPALIGEIERMHVDLSVELVSGERVEVRCDGPRGLWGRPRITMEEHLVKVRDCLATRLAPAAVERCIDRVLRLETLDAAQVGQLMADLRGG